MPKQPKPQPFMCFVQKFRGNEERRGNRMSLKEAINAANPLWTKMTPQERGPYEKQAKDARFLERPGERHTSQGVPLSMVDRQRSDANAKKKRIQKEIANIVQTAVLNNRIGDEPFYFMGANYFCKNIDGDYIPAEISLSKFTLKDGSTSIYHTYMNPVKLPVGYALTAREHSQATHQLPTPPKANGEHNWCKVFKDMLKHMGCTALDTPPIFTTSDQIDVIESILKQICADASEDLETFLVCPLHQLLYVMKEETCKYGLNEDSGFKSVHIAEAVLQRDEYDYRSGLACNYHEEQDISKYCTLSLVKRWGFTFSEHISPNAGVELVKGKHLPLDEEKNFDEDTRSEISHRTTTSYTSTLTHLTQPIKYPITKTPSMISEMTEDNIETKTNFKKENDFPPLGFTKKSKSGHNSTSSYAEVSGFQSKPKIESDGNAWSRPTTEIRAPSEASFIVTNVSQGRGRGLLASAAKVASGINIGRGRVP